jgi:hypothetical protein
VLLCCCMCNSWHFFKGSQCLYLNCIFNQLWPFSELTHLFLCQYYFYSIVLLPCANFYLHFPQLQYFHRLHTPLQLSGDAQFQSSHWWWPSTQLFTLLCSLTIHLAQREILLSTCHYHSYWLATRVSLPLPLSLMPIQYTVYPL